MAERWASFDCYGTLIDWNGGVRMALGQIWPDADMDRLLRRYHAIGPLIEEGRSLPNHQVMVRTLRAVAEIEGLPLAPEQEQTLAASLPSWPAFPEVRGSLETLRDSGWRLAILSNTDPNFLAASLAQIGVPVDLVITVAEAGSYKPAHGHWQRFYQESGADRAHHIHVAASLFHDIAPAAELGLRTVWINREGERSDLPRTAELPEMGSLAAVLDDLVPSRG